MVNTDSRLSETQIRVNINDKYVVVDSENSLCDPISIVHVSGSTYSILYQGRSLSATLLLHNDDTLAFSVDGSVFRCVLKNRRMQLLEDFGISNAGDLHEGEITSPMPGLVIKILTSPGAQVQKGDPLLVLEAMKMENEIRSPLNATILNIHVISGESVPKNALLISLDALPST